MGADAPRLEADHELIWADAEAATRALLHPSHGWAIEPWKQRRKLLG